MEKQLEDESIENTESVGIGGFPDLLAKSRK